MAAIVFNQIQSVFDGCIDQDKFDVENNAFVVTTLSSLPEKRKRVADFARTLPWNTYSIRSNANLLWYFYSILNEEELREDDVKAKKQMLQLYLTHLKLKVTDAELEKLAKNRIPFYDTPDWLPYLKDTPIDNVDPIFKVVYKYHTAWPWKSKLLELSAPWLRGITDEGLIKAILFRMQDRYVKTNAYGILTGLGRFMVGLNPQDRLLLLNEEYFTRFEGKNVFARIAPLKGNETVEQRIQILKEAGKLECDEICALKEQFGDTEELLRSFLTLPCDTRRDTLENDDKPLNHRLKTEDLDSVFRMVNFGLTVIDVQDQKLIVVRKPPTQEADRARRERIALFARGVSWSNIPLNPSTSGYLEFFYRSVLAQNSPSRRAERTLLQLYLKSNGFDLHNRLIGYLVQIRATCDQSLHLATVIRGANIPIYWNMIKGMQNLDSTTLSVASLKQAQPWIANVTHWLEIQTLLKAIASQLDKENRAILTYLEKFQMKLDVQDKLRLLERIPVYPLWGPANANLMQPKPTDTIDYIVLQMENAIEAHKNALPPPPLADELPPLDPAYFDY